MEEKYCPRCTKTKPINQFHWKIKNKKRSTYCKRCANELIKNHYKNNRQYYLDKARRRNYKLRISAHKLIAEYFHSHSCIDCGESDISVLEFDHRDRSRKTMEINRIIRHIGLIDKLSEEIKKCDVRCVNCHRKKTARETNSWRLKYKPS